MGILVRVQSPAYHTEVFISGGVSMKREKGKKREKGGDREKRENYSVTRTIYISQISIVKNCKWLRSLHQ